MSMSKRAIWGTIIIGAISLFVPGLSIAGSLEPRDAPAPTMKSLNQIPPTWSMEYPCTTKTNCPRFVLLTDSYKSEAILDKDTGLVWEKSPGADSNTWQNAQVYCTMKMVGGRKGWRLPTIEELASLMDETSWMSGPDASYLPTGHPFTNIQGTVDDNNHWYWSSTDNPLNNNEAWFVSFFFPGGTAAGPKSSTVHWWCVRGGQGRIGQ